MALGIIMSSPGSMANTLNFSMLAYNECHLQSVLTIGGGGGNTTKDRMCIDNIISLVTQNMQERLNVNVKSPSTAII